MAPAPQESTISTTMAPFFKQTSNTKNPSSMRSATKSTRIITIGQQTHHVALSHAPPVAAIAWKKQDYFDQLERTVNGFRDSQSIAALTSFVHTELPVNLAPAFEEAQEAEQKIKEMLFHPQQLQIIKLTDSKGIAIPLKSLDIRDRPDGIAFVHFESFIDPSLDTDPRIKQEATSFKFALSLPQTNKQLID